MARTVKKVETARMQMSPIGQPSRDRPQGFTLLELLIVIVILGIFSAVFSVRIEGVLSGGDLRLASRLIIGEIYKLRGRAAYASKDLVLTLDIDENALIPPKVPEEEVESLSVFFKGRYEEPERLRIPKGVKLEDVVVFSHGKIQEGKAYITFFANGCVDRSLIHLRNEKDAVYTLEINPLTGQVKTHDRYIEQKTKI
jgi:prepilin-type N-terminal cleavage/methylation domain-containing protein